MRDTFVEKPRVLVAGIGNIFLGDDAFGVEVVRRLALRPWPEEVRVVDFGIRGFDLAFALMEDYDLVILVDATPRGGQPGTLYVIEPEPDDPDQMDTPEIMVETHGMNPMKVLPMVQSMGGKLPPLRLVGCEPAFLGSEEDPAMGLSETVLASVDEAVRIIEGLVAEVLGSEASLPLCQLPFGVANTPSRLKPSRDKDL
jgi:hydrogenase maturation protease